MKTIQSWIIKTLIILIVLFFAKREVFLYFMQKNNARILSEIKKETPQYFPAFVDFITDIEKETTWHVRLTSGFRTFEEQKKCGRSRAVCDCVCIFRGSLTSQVLIN